MWETITSTEKQKEQQKKYLAPRWKKGESGGHSGGRKPKNMLTKDLLALIQEVGEGMIKDSTVDLPNGRKKASRREMLIRKAWEEALAGDFNYFKEIMDRLGGKPISRHEISGPDQKPIAIVRAAGKGEDADVDDDD